MCCICRAPPKDESMEEIAKVKRAADLTTHAVNISSLQA
jgi:hypothetical protein